jgi:cell division protein FtsZ
MIILRLALLALIAPTAVAYTITFSGQHRSTTLSMKLQESDDFITSRQPHKLKNGRGVFLGFRNVKDVTLQSSSSALMPDGGLSPCVIRVLGVGGGGCNAVSV